MDNNVNYYSLAKNITNNNIVFYAVLIVICGFIYHDIFSLKYFWDDHYVLFEYGLTSKSFFHGLITAWTKTFLPENVFFYRPFVLTSYFLGFYFFGTNPVYAHAINLLLLIINSILVYKTSLLFLNDFESKESNLRAKLIAIVYATSPVLVESTAWVSCRFDLLCTTFMLLAIINYVNLESYYKLVVVSFFCLCAVLCKEEAFIFPYILLVIESYFDVKYHKTDKINKKLKFLFWIMISLVTYVFYIELRYHMMLIGESIHYKFNVQCLDNWHCTLNNKKIEHSIISIISNSYNKGKDFLLNCMKNHTNGFAIFVVYLNEIFSTFNEYIKTLLFPFFYACTEHTNVSNIYNIQINKINKDLSYIIINVFIQAIIGMYLFFITRKKNKRVFLLVLMYLISISLVVNIYPAPELLNAQDRFLTFPIIFVLVAVFRTKYNSNNLFFLNAIKFLVCAFIIIDCIVVYNHVSDFKTDVVFWTKRSNADPMSHILLLQKKLNMLVWKN